MYLRISSLLPIAALIAVVAGAPASIEARQSGECNTGTLQCCNSITTPSNPTTTALLNLFGVNTGSVSGIVGLTCSGNVGSSPECTQEPVCCNNDTFNGVIVIGCSPITVSVVNTINLAK